MDRIRYLSSWSQITLLVTDEQGNAKAYTLWNGRQEPAPRFYLYAASKSQTLCPGAKQIQTTSINQEHNYSTINCNLFVYEQACTHITVILQTTKLTTKNMILPYLFVPCFLPLLVWVAIGIGIGTAAIAIIIILTTPDKKTTRIAILGLKASGKTTLWNGLRGARFSSDYQVTGKQTGKQTGKEEIGSFTIEKDGKEITIEKGSDIGGGRDWVQYYDDLIKDGTFVFYLVKASDKSSESKSSIRARVQKIIGLMNNASNCGARILITHIDKCYGMQRAEIISSIKEWLDLESVKIDGKTAKYEYDAVNLTSASDIEYIKQMIIDNVYG